MNPFDANTAARNRIAAGITVEYVGGLRDGLRHTGERFAAETVIATNQARHVYRLVGDRYLYCGTIPKGGAR